MAIVQPSQRVLKRGQPGGGARDPVGAVPERFQEVAEVLDHQPRPVCLDRVTGRAGLAEGGPDLHGAVPEQASGDDGHGGILPGGVESHLHLVLPQLLIQFVPGAREFLGDQVECDGEGVRGLSANPLRERPGRAGRERAQPDGRLGEPTELDLEVPGLSGAPGEAAEAPQRAPADGVVQLGIEGTEPGAEAPQGDPEVVQRVLAWRLLALGRGPQGAAETLPGDDPGGVPGGACQQVGSQELQSRGN